MSVNDSSRARVTKKHYIEKDLKRLKYICSFGLIFEVVFWLFICHKLDKSSKDDQILKLDEQDFFGPWKRAQAQSQENVIASYPNIYAWVKNSVHPFKTLVR